jgi:uncharacterized protein (DUF2147 family)
MWLYLGFLLAAHPAPSALGAWLTQDRKAVIEMAPCLTDATHLCGTITQLPPPQEGNGLDNYNPDPRLRRQPVLGLTILTDFKPAAPDARCPWQAGKVYDPDSGKVYHDIELCVKDTDHLVLTKALHLGPFQTGVAGETWSRVHK